jgi:hypothetical protein
MTRICWRLVDIVSRMLEPYDRDAVRGDFAESGEPCGRALRGVVSLIIRRQLALWKDWRPWLALVGLVGIAAVLLSEIALRLDVAVSQQMRTYLVYGVPYETGLTIGQDIVYMGCLAVALLAWSWTSGFVLGSLSGRAIWLTGALFYLVVLDSFVARLFISNRLILHDPPTPFTVVVGWVLPFSFARILFTFAAIWGVNRGLRLRTLGFRTTALLTIGIIILAALVARTSRWHETAQEIWSRGLWRGGPPTRLLPLALLSWPAGFILATATWRRWRSNTAPN